MFYEYYILGIILLPGILLAIYAQTKVHATFDKFSEIGCEYDKPAHEIARMFLDSAGLHDIQVVKVRGHLTDYYNHRKKIIALSENVYDSKSIAAIGIACHEVGHAIQYKSDYLPIKIRNVIIPVCNVANNFLWVLMLLGALFFYTNLGMAFLWVGAGVFALSVLLNLVTLPVEYNASKRATQLLGQSTVFNEREVEYTKKVLDSAALTYVAGLVVSILNLLRLLLLIFSNSSRRD